MPECVISVTDACSTLVSGCSLTYGKLVSGCSLTYEKLVRRGMWHWPHTMNYCLHLDGVENYTLSDAASVCYQSLAMTWEGRATELTELTELSILQCVDLLPSSSRIEDLVCQFHLKN
jgi:hypothetical protein